MVLPLGQARGGFRTQLSNADGHLGLREEVSYGGVYIYIYICNIEKMIGRRVVVVVVVVATAAAAAAAADCC